MDKKKKNILIGGLLAVVVLLAVGYAAFATNLTINGTSSIDSRWDVHIKEGGVSYKNAVSATSTKAQKDSQLTASFACELTDPGVSTIDYDVIVENSGTFGAKLSSINLTGTTAYIDATTSGIEVGDVIDPNGGIDTLTVTVSYKDVSTVPTGEDATANITVTLNYVQAGGAVATTTNGGGSWTPPTEINGLTIDQTFVPQYYEYHLGKHIKINDAATTTSWTQDPTTLNKYYYLGHDVDGSGNVTANYVCFIIDDTQYCMRADNVYGTYWKKNKGLLETLKTAEPPKVTCTTWDSNNAFCNGGTNVPYIRAYLSDDLYAGSSSSKYCTVRDYGHATCVDPDATFETLTIDQTFVPQYYTYDTTNEVYVGDTATTSSWTQDPTTLNKIYYLGHDVDSNGKVSANYACFITVGTQYCMRGVDTEGGTSYFTQNKAMLQSLINEKMLTCDTFNDTQATNCQTTDKKLKYFTASSSGNAFVGLSSTKRCFSNYIGKSICKES